jgi:hypothetical protein
MFRKAMAAAAILAVGIIAGCGGGTSATPSATTVSGVAATGAPMSGTAYLKDSTGNQISAPINPQTGMFTFDVSGKTPPFMVTAGTLYSMSGRPGTANVNPLSNLMVANMGGFSNMSTMHSFYKNPNGTTMQAMFGNMSTSRLQMWQKMGPLFSTYGVPNVDPISTPYAIGNGLDRMFDNVHMSIDQYGNVTMMNTSSAPIYTGSMGNMMGWTMMSGNITQPGTGQTASGITITPANNATLSVNGTQQFSANIPVTWSVGLNSGTITSGGLYTAPPYMGMFLVKATSNADPTKVVTVTVYVGGMGMGMMW